MNKSAVAGALLALTGTALVAPPAAAAPALPAPVVTITDVIITGGLATVSELLEVTASGLHSSAVSVRLQYDGLPAQVVEVNEGAVPPFSVETWGLASTPDRHLVVAQCRESGGLDCGVPSDITTTIANPAPTYDLSRPGSEFAEPFDLTAHLQHATGAPRLRLVADAGSPTYVDPDEVTPVATAVLTEGGHQIDIAVCSADELRCTTGETVTFTVARSAPGVFSVSAPAFSPNGDGKFDTVAFNFTQQVVWDSAAVEVRSAADQPVFNSAVPLPQAPSNAGTFPYDGKDTLGAALPDGAYTATLSVTRTLDSGDTAASTYQQPFTVDTTALVPGAPVPQWSTIYPYADGYRDATRFTYSGAEPYSRVDLQVFTPAPDFTPIRSKRVIVAADASWNGRDNAGARVPAGSYQVRLRVVDVLGNVGFTPLTNVNVNDKKLVTVTKAVTVTPKASRIGGVTGACSTRRTPSLHGWAGSTGYLSNTKCRTTFKASRVWTHNRVHLPSAVTYRWVRLGWYGGPTKAATRDRAIATLYGTDNSALGWFSSVDYMAAQYIPSVKGSVVVEGGDVSWGFQTDRGNRYDVKSFTITYRADVLR